MTNERVRVAFLGAGKQANWRHYPSLHSMPDVELVALCDRVEDRALETAKRVRVRIRIKPRKPNLAPSIRRKEAEAG